MSNLTNLAEKSAVTPSSVVTGMGYPNDYIEVSDQPTGWQVTAVNTSHIELEKKVSRETF